MKYFFIVCLLLPAAVLSQQRYLVTPDNEVIPLTKGESALDAAKRAKIVTTSHSSSCPDAPVFGYRPQEYPPQGRISTNNRDLLGMWFIAPASGTIDTVFWEMADANAAKDSFLYIRIHESNIFPGHGPGDGTYPSPCVPWGYWINTADLRIGIAAFVEDAFPDTNWHSTTPGGTPSFVPFGKELWGLGGYPVTGHANSVNHVAMLDLGQQCSVKVDQPFFISMRPQPLQFCWFGFCTTRWLANASQSPLPARDWKFYAYDSGVSAPNCSGAIPSPKGWIARGGGTGLNDGFVYNWWYTMTATSNTPPVIVSVPDGDAHTTLSTGPQTIDYEILDCNPAHPESAGVAATYLEWSNATTDINLTFTPQNDIQFLPFFGDLWEVNVPGQPCGTTIRYRVRATDMNGGTSYGVWHTYKVVCLSPNQYYMVDTSSNCVMKSIASTGTVIDTSLFFLPHYSGSGTHPKDDGTAGPFDLGGPMVFFGDTVRYVWVGVNGAMALSKSPTDTQDVSSNGYPTAAWDFPNAQHHGRADINGRNNMPGNFIAPFWFDFLYGDSSGAYGTIRRGNGGDSCQFIVEWDSIGTDWWTEIPPPTTFRVILNRCDGSIEFQYDHGIEGYGIDSLALVGMQADSNAISGPKPGYVFINKNGLPSPTRPRNNWCVKFYPGAQYFATDGWNLVSVATLPNDYHRKVLYPSGTSFFSWRRGPGYYLPGDFLANGEGYWIKFSGRSYAGAPGKPLYDLVMPVRAGWNMIGSISKSVPTASIIQTPPGIVSSGYFGSTPAGYYPSSTVDPGRGYWVKTLGDGSLHLTAPSVLPKTVVSDLDSMNSLSISDQSGNRQTLYFGDEKLLREPLSQFELPPAAPEFDVRFASGRLLETYSVASARQKSYVYPLHVKTDAYPLTIHWHVQQSSFSVALLVNGKPIALHGSALSTIEHPTSDIKLRISSATLTDPLPTRFALEQNYPNPFNPSTVIRYELPVRSHVTLKVYDVLGQEVATLVDGMRDAGYESVEWDAGKVANGIYFYTLTANEFTETRKMLLIR